MGVSESQVRAAYAECQRLASRNYENFPTATYLGPKNRAPYPLYPEHSVSSSALPVIP